MRGKVLVRVLVIILILAGATVFFRNQSPKSGVIELIAQGKPVVGQTFETPLTISVDQTINAGEFVFNFPPELLSVKEIKKDGSFYQLWVTDSPSFSNEAGTISLAGGLPSPGFSGTGTVATIVFEAKKAGSAEITLDTTKSQLLANDGLGTIVPARFKPVTFKLK